MCLLAWNDDLRVAPGGFPYISWNDLREEGPDALGAQDKLLDLSEFLLGVIRRVGGYEDALFWVSNQEPERVGDPYDCRLESDLWGLARAS